MTGPRFCIAAAIDHAEHTGLHDRAGTHWTGFQRDIERAIFEPPVAEHFRRVSESENLRVGRRVLQLNAPIVRRRDDRVIPDNDAADGDFVLRGSEPGFYDGGTHPRFVIRVHLSSLRKNETFPSRPTRPPA